MIMRRFVLPKQDRKRLTEQLKELLKGRNEIQFAYLHGSFVEKEFFRDVDLAIYVGQLIGAAIDYELNLEVLLRDKMGYPFDVRLLNHAPLSFCYEVIKSGKLFLVSNDDNRSEFEERVILAYLDFAFHQRNYLKEVLALGV